MIDLQQFCSTDPERPYLHRPGSFGVYSYATNGHILVRVSQRDDVAERKEFPNCERPIGQCSFDQAFVALPPVKMPPVSEVRCPDCDGRGFDHDCPECNCACVICNTKGEVSSDEKISVVMDGVGYALKYIRLLAALPGIEIPAKVEGLKPMPFRFAGGIGCLMPMKSPHDTNIVVRP